MRYLWVDAQVGPLLWSRLQFGPQRKRRRADSVARCEQPARDHLRLDLGRALENAENAGIAKDARDRKLERETVAAVNLHGVIGIGPGDAGGQELRHAGLEIAALARILLPRREVSELARDHDLDRHHRDFVGDAGKTDDRLAELLALLGIGEGLVHGRLRHADRARRGLDARRLEGLHELPKAQSLDAAEQVLRLHLETVEGDLVLLHAAISR